MTRSARKRASGEAKRVAARQPRADRDMSAFDAFLFRGEEHPRTRAQVTAAYLLDGKIERARFAATFDRASRLVRRMRQRVVAPPLPVFLPCWVVDPDFDLGQHLRYRRAPGRGSLEDLLKVVQDEVMRPLDCSRPLWEALLVEALAGGRAAVIIKMSHAVTDGIGALELFGRIFDTASRARRGPMPPAPIPEDVTPEELQRNALAQAPSAVARATVGATRSLLQSVAAAWSDPRQASSRAEDYLRSLGRTFGSTIRPSPALSGRSAARRCVVLDAPLADFRRAGKAAGASVNDVYLAAVVGALRRYHEALGAPVDALPLAIPVNLRKAGDPAAGNFFGGIVLAAPVRVADPRERTALLHEQVLRGRAEPAIGAPAAISPVVARLPDVVLRGVIDRTPRPDVQASNLPGSPVPLYFAGRRVRAAYAFGPVPGVAAMVTMQSMGGTCFVAVNLDPAAVADPELFARCLGEGFAEVLALGGRVPKISRPVVGRRPPEGAT